MPKALTDVTSRIQVDDLFEKIGLDFVGPLPETKRGNKYILVATEYFSRWPLAMASPSATGQVVADFIYDQIIAFFGCPLSILTDQGSHFKNEMIARLCEQMRVKHSFTTPYNPKCNGLTERFNKSLCLGLAKMVFDKKGEWDENVSAVLLAYRHKIHSETGHSPYYLLFGKEPKLPPLLSEKFKALTQHVDENQPLFEQRLQELQNAAGARKELSNQHA